MVKPEKLAQEIVSDHMTVGDIKWLISEHSTSDPRREKLLAAVYPGYPEVKKRFYILLDYCKHGVDTAEIEDLHLQALNAYSAAAFQLGFAAAMQLRNPTEEP